MKQKIRFEKNLKTGILTMLESSEVDPSVVMPLHEEEYSLEEMANASVEGDWAFSQLLRRRSFFPTSGLCTKLYENTIEFFKDETADHIVIEYDDAEAFPKEKEFVLEDEDVELEKILEEDGTTDDDEIKEIDSGDDNLKFTPEDTSEHEN